MLILLMLTLLLVGFTLGRGSDGIDRRTVERIDLPRYMGDWYEIARYDHPFERGLREVRTSYRLRDDGEIEVINCGVDARSGKRKTIRGKARTTPQIGRLQVSFFWIFYSDYDILELGDAYDWAIIGGRSARRLWILSRTPTLPAPTLHRILALAHRRGYAVDRLLFVEQQGDAAGQQNNAAGRQDNATEQHDNAAGLPDNEVKQ